MRALILAQGTGARWQGADGSPYLGGPKQLVVRVDGETVLARTVRLLGERGVSDVVVVGPDERFHAAGAELVILDEPSVSGCDMDKFFATRHLWAAEDRTVILWGDCYYTDAAMDTIVGHQSDDLHYFRRPWKSTTTGHRWDESFAVSFGSFEHERVLAIAEHVASLWRRRRIKATHIRTHYAASLGLPDRQLDDVRAVRDTPGQTIIDDFTEDFDRPEEWCSWMGRYHAGRYKVAVISPFRPGCEWREAAAGITAAHWADIGVPVYYGDNDGPIVNRSAARNYAAAQALAEHPDLDVLFVADTDTWVSADQFWAACHLAVESGQLTRAYSQWHKLTRAFAQQVRAGSRTRSAGIGQTARNHASAALAVTPALWGRVGGFDERFRGWGGEDRAFWLACQTLAGWGWHVNGPAWHVWHPPAKDRNGLDFKANIALGMRYKAAAGVVDKAGILPASFTPIAAPDPVAMEAILGERGGPLADGPSVGVPVALAPSATVPPPTLTAPPDRPRRPSAAQRRPMLLPPGRVRTA